VTWAVLLAAASAYHWYCAELHWQAAFFLLEADRVRAYDGKSLPALYTRTLQNLAALRVAAGDLDAAETILIRLASDPEAGVEAQINLGIIAFKRGLLEKSLQHFRQAILRSPLSAEAWSNAGMTLGRMGRHDEAEAAQKRAAEIKGERPTPSQPPR